MANNAPWFIPVATRNGEPLPGAKLYAYVVSTTIPKPIYADVALTTPHLSPLVANADGQYPEYFMEAGEYTFYEFDQFDVQNGEPRNYVSSQGDAGFTLMDLPIENFVIAKSAVTSYPITPAVGDIHLYSTLGNIGSLNRVVRWNGTEWQQFTPKLGSMAALTNPTDSLPGQWLWQYVGGFWERRVDFNDLSANSIHMGGSLSEDLFVNSGRDVYARTLTADLLAGTGDRPVVANPSGTLQISAFEYIRAYHDYVSGSQNARIILRADENGPDDPNISIIDRSAGDNWEAMTMTGGGVVFSLQDIAPAVPSLPVESTANPDIVYSSYSWDGAAVEGLTLKNQISAALLSSDINGGVYGSGDIYAASGMPRLIAGVGGAAGTWTFDSPSQALSWIGAAPASHSHDYVSTDTVSGSVPSSDGAICIASGSRLGGLYHIKWEGPYRVDSIAVQVAATAYGEATIKVLDYLNYTNQQVFTTVSVYTNGDNSIKALVLTLANRNGGTGDIAVSYSGVSGINIGGSLSGFTSQAGFPIVNKATILSDTLIVKGQGQFAGVASTAEISSPYATLRSWTFAPTTHGAIYPAGVTPGVTNFALSMANNNGETYINGLTHAGLQIAYSTKLRAEDTAVRTYVDLISHDDLTVLPMAGTGSRAVVADSSGKLVDVDEASIATSAWGAGLAWFGLNGYNNAYASKTTVGMTVEQYSTTISSPSGGRIALEAGAGTLGVYGTQATTNVPFSAVQLNITDRAILSGASYSSTFHGAIIFIGSGTTFDMPDGDLLNQMCIVSNSGTANVAFTGNLQRTFSLLQGMSRTLFWDTATGKWM